jgi:TPR repeat protein
MKTLRICSLRLLLGCLFISLSLLAGCASTTDKATSSEKPEVILQQAKTAYFEQRYEAVFQLVFPLALAGNDKAQYVVGYLYHHGLGVEKNDREAMSWIHRAAAQGNEKALEAIR